MARNELRACSKRNQQLNFDTICPNIGFKPKDPTKNYAFWSEIKANCRFWMKISIIRGQMTYCCSISIENW